MRVRNGAIGLAALVLAVLAPILAPSSVVLTAPDTTFERLVGTLALAVAFAVGFANPRASLYGVVLLTVMEGAIRKWVVNDVVVYLLKDFVLLGVYGAVLPQLSRPEWRRPWWVLAPMALLLLLAVAYSARSHSFGQALIGLRGYALYLPLLWVAPKLLDSRRRVGGLLGLLIGLGVLEAILASLQTLTAGRWLNQLVPGALPAAVVVNGISHLRPTGTMAQVGTLAAFMIFPAVATFAVIGTARGWERRLAVAALAPLTWGVIYTASRTVLLPTLVCALLLLAYLLVRRRFATAAAAAATVALAVVVMTYQPFVGGAIREGSDSHVLRGEEYTYIDHDGKVKKLTFIVERGEPRATGGLAVRGLGSEPPSTPSAEQPRGRFAVTWRALRESKPQGHGTGTMSQGAQYLLQERAVPAESGYVKVAHELGLPALVPLISIFLAFWAASVLALLRVRDWRIAPALVALAATTVIPLLTLITFSIDYPAVALLYYVFGGLAIAWASVPHYRRS